MRSDRAVVLLSGGQDSTTCLAWAIGCFGQWSYTRALSIDYGQRHIAELEAAEKIARHMGVRHETLPFPALSCIDDSSLLRPEDVIKAKGGRVDEKNPEGLPTSFVPGRNLLLISLAAAYAVKHRAGHVVVGVCETDYSGYPDCRREFIESLDATINLAMPSSCPIMVHTPLMDLSKAETVLMAKSYGKRSWEALGMSITCYEGQHGGCGTCPACHLRSDGFRRAGFDDPAFDGDGPE